MEQYSEEQQKVISNEINRMKRIAMTFPDIGKIPELRTALEDCTTAWQIIDIVNLMIGELLEAMPTRV